ncbi:MAG: sulfotransferase [Magnetococcales bacterium]|nr:sulfotransferase [Magnetococcales bacterium]
MPNVLNIHKILDSEIRRKNIESLRFALRGYYRRLANIEPPHDPVFVIGCSRAGTTVTFETIACHPTFKTLGYELTRLWHHLHHPGRNSWHSEAATSADANADHRNAILSHWYQRLGNGWYLDKSCINTLRIPYLYALFPKARFIYVHRDGRSNISSLMDGWRQGARFDLRQYLGDLPERVAITDGEHTFNHWCFFLPSAWREFNEASLEEVCAHQWNTANRMALEGRAVIPDRQWIQVAYEDLFSRPVALFSEICEKLEIPFDPAVEQRCSNLTSHQTSIVNGPPALEKWRSRNPEAIEKILPQIAPLMDKLGYPIQSQDQQ